MSLQQFLLDNRLELIERARADSSARPSSQSGEAEVQRGMPLFLLQLATTLHEEGDENPAEHEGRWCADSTAITQRSPSLDGQILRRVRFAIEKVVNQYGCLSRAVAELAAKQGITISVEEFHALDQCLDNAIAGATNASSDKQKEALAKGRKVGLLR